MVPKKIWHKKKKSTVKAVPKKGAAKKKAFTDQRAEVGELEDRNEGLKELNVVLGLRVVELGGRVVELENWIHQHGVDRDLVAAILVPAAKPVTVVADPPQDDPAA